MAINDLVNSFRRGALGLSLVLASCGSGAGDEATFTGGCKNDSECKGNRIYIDGERIERSRNTHGKDIYTSLPDTYDNLDTSQNCTSHFKKVCSEDKLYWKDSCGNLENKLENCEYECSNGKCNEPTNDVVSGKDSFISDTWTPTQSDTKDESSTPIFNLETQDFSDVKSSIDIEAPPFCIDKCDWVGQGVCLDDTFGQVCGVGFFGLGCLVWNTLNYCGNGFVCEEGNCEQICLPEFNIGCYQGNLHYFDSCNNPGGFIAYCDSESECMDGTCYAALSTPVCTSNEYQCNDGGCIFLGKICDGYNDCSGGEDEWKCTPVCTSSEYQCNDGGCIPLEWICDGITGCSEGEDEEGCGTYSCTDINTCVVGCGGDNACSQACFNQGSLSAKEEHDNLDACYNNFCSEFNISAYQVKCLFENCKEQYVDCFGLIETSLDTCAEVWNCIYDYCTDDYCGSCVGQGTYNAQLDILKMIACVEVNCQDLFSLDELNACAVDNCMSEINKCVNGI